jgi:multiple sugar transport system permease protein
MAANPRLRSFSLRDFFDKERNLGIILMLPGAILLIAFMAYPFFLGIWLSLMDSMIGRIGQFIGLRNFVDLLTDTIFHQTAKNTFIYALVTVPFKAMLGLGLALVLNRHMRLSSPIRAAVMMPWIIPTALSSMLKITRI